MGRGANFVAPNCCHVLGASAQLKQSRCRMKYVSVFYEGEHNDARTNLCIAFTAAMYGAAISNYAKAASKKNTQLCSV